MIEEMFYNGGMIPIFFMGIWTILWAILLKVMNDG